MKNLFLFLQVVLSAAVISLILLQAKGTGLGRAFGGLGEFHSTKRGVEKVIFWLTIGFAGLFFISSIIQLIIF